MYRSGPRGVTCRSIDHPEDGGEDDFRHDGGSLERDVGEGRDTCTDDDLKGVMIEKGG